MPSRWLGQIALVALVREFYTSLGHPEDFENPAFRKLLLNGLLWTIAPHYLGQPPLASQSAN